VTADALPAPQIDGVVWDQVVAGNTVYVGGEFTTARPAGSKAGTNETPRSNFLAYDLHTGALLPYAPSFDAAVMSLSVSPDGKRLYAGGRFTKANGTDRYRLAAFNLPSGDLVAGFQPYMDSRVESVVATNTAVFVGGVFTTVSKDSRASSTKFARTQTAAFSATDATVLPWAPKLTGGKVKAMVISPDASKIVLGGTFRSLNGSTMPGTLIGAVDTNTGTTTLPWGMNATIPNGGAALDTRIDYSIYSLSTDGQNVYGTMGPADFEGTFKASWVDGSLGWLADCHGDTYSVQPVGDVVYTASHAHDCGNARSFEDYLPPYQWYRALALTTATTQTTRAEDGNYKNYAGQPSPTVLDWYPAFNTGTKTGTSQGPWDVTAAQGYVLYGGEFTQVNEKGQQGLVRFALPDKAPNKIAPSLAGADMKPTVTNFGGFYTRVTWPTNYDWDNANLTYQVIRNGDTSKPVFETTQPSRFWERGTLRGADGPLVPGTTYTYQIRTVDPFGNATMSDPTSYTAVGNGYADFFTSYDRTVLQDQPAAYWPLNEARGGTGYDWAGSNDLSDVPSYVDGVEPGAGTAATFNGTSQFSVSQQAVVPPTAFSQELWFKTSAKHGGVMMGMASGRGFNDDPDRQLYMADSGTVYFASITNDQVMAVKSQKALNDGAWHHVVATVGPSGSALYVDGVLNSSRADQTAGHPLYGAAYWNIGGHGIGGRPENPSPGYFDGVIDNVAVYTKPVSASVASTHYTAGKTALVEKPTYDRTVLQDHPTSYWALNEASGGTGYDWAGQNGLSGVPSYVPGIASDGGTAATFNGTSQFSVSQQTVVPPTTFSQELWFKTSAKHGGVMMGMGTSRGFGDDSMDRQLYMADSGTVYFASITNDQVMAVKSQKALNDGAWHHVVATVGPSGAALYVDGVLNSSRADQTAGHSLFGTAYWNIGGHGIGGRPENPSTGYFEGAIDNVAVYDKAVSASVVAAHYKAGGGVAPAPK
jgi:hypothetical protein